MTDKEKVNIIIALCNEEIEKYLDLMHLAERNNHEQEWIKLYELYSAYKKIHKILTGNFEV